MVVLVLAKIKINSMEHMEDYTLCDNRARAKPSTAMEVVGIKYIEPKVGGQSGPLRLETWRKRLATLATRGLEFQKMKMKARVSGL
jgi:hypothetical protein